MKIEIPAGKYVVAVSGGIDSVVLLHLLAQKGSQYTANSKQLDQEIAVSYKLSAINCQLIVAHFDHGIREDSGADRRFVQGLAQFYGLPFEYAEGKLGSDASEAVARSARYRFLEKVKQKYSADAIITAHHQDDLVETIVHNLLRGTGRRGMGALQGQGVIRPLLPCRKREVVAYALSCSLEFVEDETNYNTNYKRNFIRRVLLPYIESKDPAFRSKLLQLQSDALRRNEEIEAILYDIMPAGNFWDRNWFGNLPTPIAQEVIARKLREEKTAELPRRRIVQITAAIKSAQTGKTIEAAGGLSAKISRSQITWQK